MTTLQKLIVALDSLFLIGWYIDGLSLIDAILANPFQNEVLYGNKYLTLSQRITVCFKLMIAFSNLCLIFWTLESYPSATIAPSLQVSSAKDKPGGKGPRTSQDLQITSIKQILHYNSS